MTFKSVFNSVAVLSLLLIMGSVEASMRCDRKWVEKGATTYEVLTRCGDPVFQETIQEPITTYRQAYVSSVDGVPSSGQRDYAVETAEPEYRLINRWTYDLGTGTLLREVDFYNGEVIRIRTRQRTR